MAFNGNGIRLVPYEDFTLNDAKCEIDKMNMVLDSIVSKLASVTSTLSDITGSLSKINKGVVKSVKTKVYDLSSTNQHTQFNLSGKGKIIILPPLNGSNLQILNIEQLIIDGTTIIDTDSGASIHLVNMYGESLSENTTTYKAISTFPLEFEIQSYIQIKYNVGYVPVGFQPAKIIHQEYS